MVERQIMSLEAAACELDRLRRVGRKVVQRPGCFDLLHIGHTTHVRVLRDQRPPVPRRAALPRRA